jgi:hypothetical protein
MSHSSLLFNIFYHIIKDIISMMFTSFQDSSDIFRLYTGSIRAIDVLPSVEHLNQLKV